MTAFKYQFFDLLFFDKRVVSLYDLIEVNQYQSWLQ